MTKTKSIEGPTAKLSAESVQLINEIWELLTLLNGRSPTAEEMKSEIYIGTQILDEYGLRKVRLKYHTLWQNKGKKKNPEYKNDMPYQEGGEGQYGS